MKGTATGRFTNIRFGSFTSNDGREVEWGRLTITGDEIFQDENGAYERGYTIEEFSLNRTIAEEIFRSNLKPGDVISVEAELRPGMKRAKGLSVRRENGKPLESKGAKTN